jgi:hypothetical protein
MLNARRLALAVAGAALPLALFSAGTASAAASPAAGRLSPPTVTEHYHGHSFKLDRDTWGGAKMCVVDSTRDAYCFDSEKQAVAWIKKTSATEAPRGAKPNGYNCAPVGQTQYYVTIYGGTSYTGRALAFRDWGYSQNLGNWVQTPWTFHSWKNHSLCNAYTYAQPNSTGSQYKLYPNSNVAGMSFSASSIQLFPFN